VSTLAGQLQAELKSQLLKRCLAGFSPRNLVFQGTLARCRVSGSQLYSVASDTGFGQSLPVEVLPQIFRTLQEAKIVDSGPRFAGRKGREVCVLSNVLSLMFPNCSTKSPAGIVIGTPHPSAPSVVAFWQPQFWPKQYSPGRVTTVSCLSSWVRKPGSDRPRS
jgi:hypothetical protein